MSDNTWAKHHLHLPVSSLTIFTDNTSSPQSHLTTEKDTLPLPVVPSNLVHSIPSTTGQHMDDTENSDNCTMNKIGRAHV